MKNAQKITGLILILLMPVCINLKAQRGMHGFRGDSVIMKHDSLRMHGQMIMPGMRKQAIRQGMRNQGMLPGHGLRHMGTSRNGSGGGRPGPAFAYAERMGIMMYNIPGRRILESIPEVTAKQKEDLNKLNQAHRDEMEKLQDKHQEALKAITEEHRKKVTDLLTDEQKKWLEENSPGRGRR